MAAAPVVHSIGDTLTTDEIQHSFCINMAVDYEISGTYNEISLVFEYTKQGLPKGTSGAKSASVEVENAPIIWHTHPSCSKYYPSTEDLFKIIKNKNITTKSIIFTTYGVWVLKCDTQHKIKYNTTDPRVSFLLNAFDKNNRGNPGNIFYAATNRGKDYNLGAIQHYITEVEQIMGSVGIRYSIAWFAYPDFQTFLATNGGVIGGKKRKTKKRKTKKQKKTKNKNKTFYV